MSLRKKNYSSGKHQFQAWLRVPKGTYGVDIFQIFGADKVNTAFMMHVHPDNNGEIRRYDKEVIQRNIYNNEFRLNVIHDTKTHVIEVYIDG